VHRPPGPAPDRAGSTSPNSLAWQQQLDHRLNATTPAGRAEIAGLITQLAPTTRNDPYTPSSPHDWSLAAAGIDGRRALERAAAPRPLPAARCPLITLQQPCGGAQ
jgi:hypothetical protein